MVTSLCLNLAGRQKEDNGITLSYIVILGLSEVIHSTLIAVSFYYNCWQEA